MNDPVLRCLAFLRWALTGALLVLGVIGLVEFVDHADANLRYPGVGAVGTAAALGLAGAGALITLMMRERRAPPRDVPDP